VKTRNPGIDALRLFAILAIVAGHVWATPLTRALLYPWHVPVFFFLTGYLWSSGRTIGDELNRRSRTLLRPYVFWGVALYAGYATRHFAAGGVITDLRTGPIYGGMEAVGMFGTFWFISVLFFAALLWRVAAQSPLWVQLVIVAAGVSASALFGPQLAATPLAIGSALPAVALIAAGQLAKRVRLSRIPVLVPIAGLVVCELLVLSGVAEPLGIKEGNWGTPMLSMLIAVVMSWSLVLLAERLCRHLPDTTGAVISHLALSGFTIVLFHFTVLLAATRLALPSGVVFVLATMIPSIIGLIALRTPLSQWVTGVPQLRPDDRAGLGPARGRVRTK